VNKYPIVVGGRSIQTADHFEVRNPATGEVVGLAPKASRSQLDDAVEAAKKAFPNWSKLPDKERKNVCRAIAKKIGEQIGRRGTIRTSSAHIRYSKLDDAIARANDDPNGLSGSIWSKDICKARDLALQLERGSAWISKHGAIQPTLHSAGSRDQASAWSSVRKDCSRTRTCRPSSRKYRPSFRTKVDLRPVVSFGRSKETMSLIGP
jgi:acyl-CoA reductase-like NAD-dependent aldehyde dehydrogenase